MNDTKYVTVARTGEIPPGGRKIVRVGDVPVAIFHLEDGFFASPDDVEDLLEHFRDLLTPALLHFHELGLLFPRA